MERARNKQIFVILLLPDITNACSYLINSPIVYSQNQKQMTICQDLKTCYKWKQALFYFLLAARLGFTKVAYVYMYVNLCF